jgi:BlaI family transcriptional regulator, penicillinase repressor
MARRGSEHPTQLELEILKILWEVSPLSARDVREQLKQQSARDLAYSSVITMLNIMVRKGYLKRRKDGKAFLFTPRVDRESVAGEMTGDLLSRLFDGSASAMVLNLIETADLDAEELTELRRLITRKSREQQS